MLVGNADVGFWIARSSRRYARHSTRFIGFVD